MSMLRTVMRQLWMHQLNRSAEVDRALKHPHLRDRAAVENSLSRLFFTPFVHQEVLEGEAFAVRSGWSQRALARMSNDHAIAVAERAFEAWFATRVGSHRCLLTELRALSFAVTLELTLGEVAPGLRAAAQTAVDDFDHAIKMVAPPSLQRRLPLQAALSRFLAEDASWAAGPCYLSLAPADARALPLQEQVDHVASVFLGTGTIQLSDTLCHALIALAQNPAAREHSDEHVICETMRCFPVNASLSRQVSATTWLGGRRLVAGEAVTVVPRTFNQQGWARPHRFEPGRWQRQSAVSAGSLRAAAAETEETHSAEPSHGRHFAFGVGPRACPARRVALILCETLLGRLRRDMSVSLQRGYRHRRSLAWPASVTFAPTGVLVPPPAPGTTASQHFTRYFLTSATTYPRAFLSSLPQIVRNARAAGRTAAGGNDAER